MRYLRRKNKTKAYDNMLHLHEWFRAQACVYEYNYTHINNWMLQCLVAIHVRSDLYLWGFGEIQGALDKISELSQFNGSQYTYIFK